MKSPTISRVPILSRDLEVRRVVYGSSGSARRSRNFCLGGCSLACFDWSKLSQELLTDTVGGAKHRHISRRQRPPHCAASTVFMRARFGFLKL
jgi:hypothetical protein